MTPRGRKPTAPGEKMIGVTSHLSETEVQKLDHLARRLRHTRTGYAGYLLSHAIEQEYAEVTEKDGVF